MSQPLKYIWIKGKKYYWHDTYNTYNEARKVAKRHKRKQQKNKYFILPHEVGYWFPKKKYSLYMTHFWRLY